jgi:hypothetical protein
MKSTPNMGLDFIDNRALFLVSLLIYMLGLDFIDNRALFLVSLLIYMLDLDFIDM